MSLKFHKPTKNRQRRGQNLIWITKQGSFSFNKNACFDLNLDHGTKVCIVENLSTGKLYLSVGDGYLLRQHLGGYLSFCSLELSRFVEGQLKLKVPLTLTIGRKVTIKGQTVYELRMTETHSGVIAEKKKQPRCDSLISDLGINGCSW